MVKKSFTALFFAWVLVSILHELMIEIFNLSYDAGFPLGLIWWLLTIAGWPFWMASEFLFSIDHNLPMRLQEPLENTLALAIIVIVYFLQRRLLKLF